MAGAAFFILIIANIDLVKFLSYEATSNSFFLPVAGSSDC